MYNKNFLLKNVGYFQIYIYKYNEYLINKNLLEPLLLQDKYFIIYLSYKDLEYNITGMCYFNNYFEFLDLLNNKLNQHIKNIINIKNILISIKIWQYKEISEYRIKVTAQKAFDKKLTRFQKVLNKLIDYKVKTSNKQLEYSRFLTEKILTKELKPVLHIKVEDELLQQECLKHLLNLMSKKWLGVSFNVFKAWMHKTIKIYQDNWEHEDAWEIEIKEKKK